MKSDGAGGIDAAIEEEGSDGTIRRRKGKKKKAGSEGDKKKLENSGREELNEL